MVITWLYLLPYRTGIIKYRMLANWAFNLTRALSSSLL